MPDGRSSSNTPPAGWNLPRTKRRSSAQAEALQALYRQLQQQLTDEEARRAAVIRARLDETLKRLKAERGIDKVSTVSPVPTGDGRTVDLTADLIRAADMQLAAIELEVWSLPAATVGAFARNGSQGHSVSAASRWKMARRCWVSSAKAMRPRARATSPRWAAGALT